jgi:hypothetical protein
MEQNREKIRDKRLDNLKPFKKGKSGNPKGRPVGQRNYHVIYKEALIKLAALNETTPESLENEILSKGITLARKGDYRFYKDLLDRLHGLPDQNINVSGAKEVAKKLDDILDENVKNNGKAKEGSPPDSK